MIGCLGTLFGVLISAGICAIIGAIVRAITNIDIMFWIVLIGLFILGLPGMLISGIFSDIGDFFHRENEYAQDREDLRQMDADIAADERMDRYLDKLDDLKEDYDNKPNIYIDNRQVHFHNYKNSKKTKRIKKEK